MKVHDQFILRTIADEYILIPTGEMAFQVKGMLALTESGALLFERLKRECTVEDLVAALTAEYEVSEEEASRDTLEFLEKLRRLMILVED